MLFSSKSIAVLAITISLLLPASLKANAKTTEPSNNDLHLMILGLKHEIDQLKDQNKNLKAQLDNLYQTGQEEISLKNKITPTIKNSVLRSLPLQKPTQAFRENHSSDSLKNQEARQFRKIGNPLSQKPSKFYALARAAYSIPNDISGSVNTAKSGKDEGSANLSDGFGMGLGVGYNFTKNYRAEFEISRTKYDLQSIVSDDGSRVRDSSGDIAFYNFMLSGYYDFEKRGKVTPYIGAGIGASYLRLSDIVIGVDSSLGSNREPFFDSSKVAWIPTGMFAVGATYEIDKDLSLDFSYRLGASGDLSGSRSEGSGDTGLLINHNISAGIRYNLNFF
jgi:opacity protein-like surface antigen